MALELIICEIDHDYKAVGYDGISDKNIVDELAKLLNKNTAVLKKGHLIIVIPDDETLDDLTFQVQSLKTLLKRYSEKSIYIMEPNPGSYKVFRGAPTIELANP